MNEEYEFLNIEEIGMLPLDRRSTNLPEGEFIDGIIVYDKDGNPRARRIDNFSEKIRCRRRIVPIIEVGENLGEDLGIEAEEPFMPILWESLEAEEFPPQSWTIKNLIPREGLVILASASGEKKTWIALDMARCIAWGKDFLGNEDFKTEKRNVLYIDQEMPRSELQRRGKLLKMPKNVWFASSHGNLDLNKDVEKLYSFVEEKEIEVIFIDTLRAVAGGLREDKAEEVRRFFNLFKKFKDEGVAVIFLDHCRKPRPQEGSIPRKDQLIASQDKVASVEVLLMLKSKPRDEEIFIYPLKYRNGIEYEPFRISITDLVDDQMKVIGVELKYAGKFDERELKKDEAKESILSILAGGERTGPDLIEAIRNQSKIGEKNIRDALRALEKSGSIDHKRNGRKNSYFLKESRDDSNQLNFD